MIEVGPVTESDVPAIQETFERRLVSSYSTQSRRSLFHRPAHQIQLTRLQA